MGDALRGFLAGRTASGENRQVRQGKPLVLVSTQN
jgi:hypothetical protein